MPIPKPTETAGPRHRITIAHNILLSQINDVFGLLRRFIHYTQHSPECSKTDPYPERGRREEKTRRRTESFHPPDPELAKTGSFPMGTLRILRTENEAREAARPGAPGEGWV